MIHFLAEFGLACIGLIFLVWIAYQLSVLGFLGIVMAFIGFAAAWNALCATLAWPFTKAGKIIERQIEKNYPTKPEDLNMVKKPPESYPGFWDT